MGRCRPARRPNRRTAGFTLIEVMATLALTALTLGVMFTIGMRTVGTSFRLGQRAVGHANEQVQVQAVKDVMASMITPVLTPPSQAAETEDEANDQSGMGDEFDGAANSLAGYVVAARDNPCLPVGGEGRITLTFKPGGGRTLIQCQVNTDPAVTLADLEWPNARFSYSEDGATWTDSWQVIRGQTVNNAILPDSEQREVYVRIASNDGAHQIVELIQSGRKIPQTATSLR